MVEYAFLNVGAGLKLLGARVMNFAAGVDWTSVALVVAVLILLRLLFGGRKRAV
jgi:hypothetical protein